MQMWAEAESGHLEDLYKTIARFDEIIGGHNGVPIFVRLLQRDTIVLDTHLVRFIFLKHLQWLYISCHSC